MYYFGPVISVSSFRLSKKKSFCLLVQSGVVLDAACFGGSSLLSASEWALSIIDGANTTGQSPGGRITAALHTWIGELEIAVTCGFHPKANCAAFLQR